LRGARARGAVLDARPHDLRRSAGRRRSLRARRCDGPPRSRAVAGSPIAPQGAGAFARSAKRSILPWTFRALRRRSGRGCVPREARVRPGTARCPNSLPPPRDRGSESPPRCGALDRTGWARPRRWPSPPPRPLPRARARARARLRASVWCCDCSFSSAWLAGSRSICAYPARCLPALASLSGQPKCPAEQA